MDYTLLAEKISDITGPEANILHAANCMTRLRLQLRHATPEIQAKLPELSCALGFHRADTELQLILGPGAAQQAAAGLIQLL